MEGASLWIETDHDVTDVHGQIAEHLAKKTNGRPAVGEAGEVRTNDPHVEQKFSRSAAETSHEKNFKGERQNQSDQDESRLDGEEGP